MSRLDRVIYFFKMTAQFMLIYAVLQIVFYGLSVPVGGMYLYIFFFLLLWQVIMLFLPRKRFVYWAAFLPYIVLAVIIRNRFDPAEFFGPPIYINWFLLIAAHGVIYLALKSLLNRKRTELF